VSANPPPYFSKQGNKYDIYYKNTNIHLKNQIQ
jgi:hypothetical protein